MTRGVERIVKDSIKSTIANPKEAIFLSGFAVKNAAKKRVYVENNGEHVTPFLIASITSSCNLQCAGCYSRCMSATRDEVAIIYSRKMSGKEYLMKIVIWGLVLSCLLVESHYSVKM